MRKRLIALALLCSVVSSSLATPVAVCAKELEQGENVSQSFETNEIEIFKTLSEQSDEELSEQGLSEEEIFSIRNFDYNEKLAELSEMDNKELEELGYNQEEAKEIQAYDGTEDAAAYMKERGLVAKLSGTFVLSKVKLGHSVKIAYAFEWDRSPAITLEDEIIVAYRACNSSSKKIAMDVDKSNVEISYYYTTGAKPFCALKTKSMKDEDDYANVKIPMKYASKIHAKRVVGYVTLKTQSGGTNLSTIKVNVGYGHATVGISPSASVSTSGASISIDFSIRQSEEYDVTRTYNAEGKVIK